MNIQLTEDAEIVKLFWERDQRAVQMAEKQYGAYCKSIALPIAGSPEDAEECVNDALLQAWNAIPPHKPQMLSTFLGKITRNLAINRYRAQHREKRGGGGIPLVLEELSELVSGSDSVEHEVDRRALAEEINCFLGRLSAKKRYIFMRRYWYADSVTEIAGQCGMSENSVSVTLNRLRKALRKQLMERGFVL